MFKGRICESIHKENRIYSEVENILDKTIRKRLTKEAKLKAVRELRKMMLRNRLEIDEFELELLRDILLGLESSV